MSVTSFRLRRWACTVCMVLCVVTSLQVTASAHELLPVELILYLEEHPDATPEELRAFMETQPAIANADPEYRQRLLDTIFTARVPFWSNAWSFIVLGIKHIVGGTDHILFVLSLMLTFVSLRQTLKSISAFTVSHSITLILAGLGIITLSSRLVESMVALSIVFVAIGTVFFKRYRIFASLESKVAIIFLFGLFHGLGFAGLLQTLTIPDGRFVSSLLFFNVGIEIGQLAIIAMIIPLITVFKEKAWYPRAVQVTAALIGAAASFWFLERAFGLNLGIA